MLAPDGPPPPQGAHVGRHPERPVQHHAPRRDGPRARPTCSASSPRPSARWAATSGRSTWSGPGTGRVVRELVVNASDQEHAERDRRGGRGPRRRHACVSSFDRTFRMHQGGKIEMTTRVPLETRDDLSIAYMPGVARVCKAIAEDRSKAFDLTLKRNMVAVITNGTAVLGLGDIGAAAGHAGHGGQVDALQGVRRRRLLPHLHRLEGPRGPHQDDRRDRAGLGRHQPRGHRRAGVLRGGGPPQGDARHPGLPRRPARHRDRGAGGAAQLAEDDRREDRGPEGRGERASAPRASPARRSS